MAKYKDADELLKRLNSCKYPAEKTTMRQAIYNAAISDACRIVDAIPAFDIPRWTPVTEMPPEQEGQYLVCCNNKHHRFEVARFYINYDGDRWFCCDWNNPDDIEAWMPLPEPYKGGDGKC